MVVFFSPLKWVFLSHVSISESVFRIRTKWHWPTHYCNSWHNSFSDITGPLIRWLQFELSGYFMLWSSVFDLWLKHWYSWLGGSRLTWELLMKAVFLPKFPLLLVTFFGKWSPIFPLRQLGASPGMFLFLFAPPGSYHDTHILYVRMK